MQDNVPTIECADLDNVTGGDAEQQAYDAFSAQNLRSIDTHAAAFEQAQYNAFKQQNLRAVDAHEASFERWYGANRAPNRMR